MNEMQKHEDDSARDDFERQLSEALRHVDAPQGFAVRTMRRCEEAAPPPKRAARATWLPWFPAQAWATAVLVLVIVLLIGATAVYQTQVRRERARVARLQTQFDAAMQVTSRALDHTRAQLSRRGVLIQE